MNFLMKFPILGRLINTYTSSKSSTITSATLVGLSMIGFLNQEQIQLLSGLDAKFVVPILFFFLIITFLPKVLNYFNTKKINKLKVIKEEKDTTIEILKSDILIKELEDKLGKRGNYV